MPLRGVLCRFVLALMLVFAQQQGLLHELRHTFDALAHGSEQHTPQKHACAVCVAFSGVQHLAGASTPVLPTGPRQHARPADAVFASAPATFVPAYLSRGPPLPS
ncbi:MAG: hypothetical protein JWQ76_472 [Ramlibacter sp.]|nr:hypothetical protein [Ramlibacter sp.]